MPFYLERGYDRVGGFIHPAEAVDHLRTPAQLYLALGLIRSSEEFSPADDSVHVLRWIGYRTDLYPTAIGGNDFATAESRGGTVVEPGPFRGDGFAPSEGDERIPEHKVDSVRLPHGAKILRIDSRGEVHDIALYDADTREWTPIDGAFGRTGGHRGALDAGAPGRALSSAPPPSGPMGEAYGYDAAPGYDSALGEAWGDADGHYDLVRPKPEERAAHVLDTRDREWKDADARRLHRPLEGRRIRLQSRTGPTCGSYSPTGGDGFVEVADGRFRRGVPIGELEDFFYVRTVATWRGEPFLVLGSSGEWLRLEYRGGRSDVARSLGLEPYDNGVYQIWAPAEEVTDISEQYL